MAISFTPGQVSRGKGGQEPSTEAFPALRASAKSGDQSPCVAAPATADTVQKVTMQVRRLTPLECERLQGFPDHWTLIPWGHKGEDSRDYTENLAYLISHGFAEEDAKVLAHCPDGPRYRAIGNSMAVPVMRHIGKRIQIVSDILKEVN